MTPETTAPGVARFGPYEVDVRSGEVRKFGIRIKVGEQPLRILLQLIGRPGELVTRAELRAQLWSHDTFVDFDHGLNSAIQRLRDSLSDTADKAQWIETVPRRGYRFVGQVEWTQRNVSDAAPAEPPVEVPASPANIAAAAEQVAPPAGRGAIVLRFRLWHFAVAGLALLASAVLVTVIDRGRIVKPASTIRSLAVLPLENLSGDASQEYLADGMTDEITTALAKNHGLRVVSRTSAAQYKGVHRPMREIARELGVDGIVEGSIERSASRMHLNLQLIYAATDTHIWAESYDRDVREAFSLPTELSQTIAKEVKIAVSPAGPGRPINPEAHDAYLHGRYFWFSDNDAASREYFEKAIQLQPDYAAAWSGLSDFYGAQAVEGALPPQTNVAKWETAARKSIELDDSLAEAHNSMAAFYFFGRWDFVDADAESQRAIALDPNFAEAWHLHSYILAATNRHEEAIREQKRGIELEPFQRPWSLGLAYLQFRQYDAAIAELRLRTKAQPKNIPTRLFLSDAYRFKGMAKESAEQMQQALVLEGDKTSAAAVGQAFQRGGSHAVAEWWLHAVRKSAHGYSSPYWTAIAEARAGHKEETIRLLDEALGEHSPRMVFLQNEPAFDFIHKDDRYQELVKKIGLPPVP
jgi:TolB-like protein/DNA-binding winged helix-turn-helix (wHTH) protein